MVADENAASQRGAESKVQGGAAAEETDGSEDQEGRRNLCNAFPGRPTSSPCSVGIRSA